MGEQRTDKGRFFSDGAVKLSRLTAEQGGQPKMAAKLGVARPTLNRWLTGERRPGYAGRKLLNEQLGIAMTAWDEFPTEDPDVEARPPQTGTDG